MKLLKELLFPSKCVLCGKLLWDGAMDLCCQCRHDAPTVEKRRDKISFLDSWLALWHYEDTVRRSLHRYKFFGKRHYAQSYGRLLAMQILEEEISFEVLTWVPISGLRRLKRGYDQVELMAKATARELGVEAIRCLRRVRHGRAQSRTVGAAQRRANVLGAYRAVSPERFQGKRVLLLDDIITTGATMSECARVLLTAGADKVCGGAVASARKQK